MKRNNKGFSLLELAIAVGILSLLLVFVTGMMDKTAIQSKNYEYLLTHQEMFKQVNDLLKSRQACVNTFAGLYPSLELKKLKDATGATIFEVGKKIENKKIKDLNGKTMFTMAVPRQYDFYIKRMYLPIEAQTRTKLRKKNNFIRLLDNKGHMQFIMQLAQVKGNLTKKFYFNILADVEKIGPNAVFPDDYLIKDCNISNNSSIVQALWNETDLSLSVEERSVFIQDKKVGISVRDVASEMEIRSNNSGRIAFDTLRTPTLSLIQESDDKDNNLKLSAHRYGSFIDKNNFLPTKSDQQLLNIEAKTSIEINKELSAGEIQFKATADFDSGTPMTDIIFSQSMGGLSPQESLRFTGKGKLLIGKPTGSDHSQLSVNGTVKIGESRKECLSEEDEGIMRYKNDVLEFCTIDIANSTEQNPLYIWKSLMPKTASNNNAPKKKLNINQCEKKLILIEDFPTGGGGQKGYIVVYGNINQTVSCSSGYVARTILSSSGQKCDQAHSINPTERCSYLECCRLE